MTLHILHLISDVDPDTGRKVRIMGYLLDPDPGGINVKRWP